MADAAGVWARSGIVVKVEGAGRVEFDHLRPGQILFTYLHLAPLPELTRVLLDRQVTGIAYETITRPDGSLPLLTPMSEVAGRMAIQVGATLPRAAERRPGRAAGRRARACRRPRSSCWAAASSA